MRARYGQHFLRNRGAIETMLARFDARPSDRVVEIGPGRGALTLPLVERAGPFVAVEIDRELAETLARWLECPIVTVPCLRALSDGEPLSGSELGSGAMEALRSSRPPRFVLQADALELRYGDLTPLLGVHDEGTVVPQITRPLAAEPAPLRQGPQARIRVIGNLPYAVATPLLRHMIEERHLLADALLMVQKEVADRLLASPGTKAYGVISVMTALAAQRERVLTLAPGSFSPPPKVRSTVIALRFRPPLPGFQERDARLTLLLKAAFSERRKKLAANLAKRYAQDRGAIEAWLASAGIDLDTRAERLDPDTYARLAQTLPFTRPEDSSSNPKRRK